MPEHGGTQRALARARGVDDIDNPRPGCARWFAFGLFDSDWSAFSADGSRWQKLSVR